MCIIELLPCQRLLYQALVILCLCTFFVTAQVSTQKSIAPSWPTGTEAHGSSVHSRNRDGSSFDYSNAVDGNLDTMWNDDSVATYPDILTISVPIAITLISIVIVSSEDGWLLSYYVETYDGTNWTRMAEINNATSPFQLINFFSPAIAREIRINVTQDQPGLKGEYTRIHEIYPLFGGPLSGALNSSPLNSSSLDSSPLNSSSLNSSSSLCASNFASTPSTDKYNSKKCSNVGAIAGGVVSGISAILLAALSGFFAFRKRRNKDWSDLPRGNSDLSLGNPCPATNTSKAAGTTELPAYAATPIELSHHAPLDFGLVNDTTVSEGHENPAELPERLSQNIERVHPSTTQQAHDRQCPGRRF